MSPKISKGAPKPKDARKDCFKLYEWSNFVGELGGYNFTGSNLDSDGVIGSFNTPIFDDPTVLDDPIARLRGSYITDTASGISTYTSAMYFVEQEEYLVYHLKFASSEVLSPQNQGVVVGGTRRWFGYQGTIEGGELSNPDHSHYVIEYIICPAVS